MDDIHARAPVNKQAVAVVMFKGEHFEPNKKVMTNDSIYPHKICKITRAMRMCPTFVDLKGYKFGRFTVLGLSEDWDGLWVVRCDCGIYCTRRKKTVLNPKNMQDRCEHCRHLAFLKRDEYYRRTGKEIDIRCF